MKDMVVVSYGWAELRRLIRSLVHLHLISGNEGLLNKEELVKCSFELLKYTTFDISKPEIAALLEEAITIYGLLHSILGDRISYDRMIWFSCSSSTSSIRRQLPHRAHCVNLDGRTDWCVRLRFYSFLYYCMQEVSTFSSEIMSWD
jgi:hypothetical protein